MTHLNTDGYPLNQKSLFIGIQRSNVPAKEVLDQALATGVELPIPYRFGGKWELMIGKITKITQFPDGRVVYFPQNLSLSPLKWPEAILWIPNRGECGILN
ncbi:MAG TPA: hypothetical protein VL335_03750 [Candidatus Paceibacterota bacterium]|jgi:hypothetical protein|nr:hypothetical protein [Candidatus Paceibacterota bacterium]